MLLQKFLTLRLWLSVLLPVFCEALAPWADGEWYDAPQDFNVAVPVCKRPAKAASKYDCEENGGVYWDGSCYTLVQKYFEWREAVEVCKEMDSTATLTSIRSKEENDVVKGICGERMCWLGLRERRGLEDMWLWLDGEPTTYFNWHAGEPGNFDGIDENVVIMNFGWKKYNALEKQSWADGDWHSVPAGFNKPSTICERPQERRGESSYCEDGWEEAVKSCYHLFDWNCSYAEAERVCSGELADLVSIGSEEEQHFVHSLCGPRMCWLGLAQDPSTKEWIWVDGSRMVYSNWERGEPGSTPSLGPLGQYKNVAMMNFDSAWTRGKGGRWRNSHQQKARAFHSKIEAIEEQQALKYRLGVMALFVVVYMATYIARLWAGVRSPGGAVATAAAAAFVVLAGGVLDKLLVLAPGPTFGFLLCVCAFEGIYLGGASYGLFKAPVAEGSEARAPALSGVLE